MSTNGRGSESGRQPTVVVAETTTPIERKLIASWLRSDRVPKEYRADGPVEEMELDPRRLARDLVNRDDDPLVLPVGVVWLPEAGTASAGSGSPTSWR